MATYSWNFTTRAPFTVLPVVTPTHNADWWMAVPHLLWLVTCSLSANLLSSSRLISSSLRWGPFSCCLTISRSFLCCWERRVTVKWVLRGVYLYSGTIMDRRYMELEFFFCYPKKKKFKITHKTSRSLSVTIMFAYFKIILTAAVWLSSIGGQNVRFQKMAFKIVLFLNLWWHLIYTYSTSHKRPYIHSA